MNKYSLEDIIKIRDYICKSMDDKYPDDEYGTEAGFFWAETQTMIEFIKEKEEKGEIHSILNS